MFWLPVPVAGAGLRYHHVLGGQRRRAAAGTVRVSPDRGRQTGNALQLLADQPDVQLTGGGLRGG